MADLPRSWFLGFRFSTSASVFSQKWLAHLKIIGCWRVPSKARQIAFCRREGVLDLEACINCCSASISRVDVVPGFGIYHTLRCCSQNVRNSDIKGSVFWLTSEILKPQLFRASPCMRLRSIPES